jgi:catechol 2,3-dioxygenase-like lactoylglutathione lyase family enzyme
MSAAFLRVGLDAPAALLPELTEFYAGRLELRLGQPNDTGLALEVGETVLDFALGGGSPFYHFALLVPGDRFEAALAWADDRVELLPDPETDEVVFDFTDWDARAVYFHDPAGSIVELIAHRGVGEGGRSGAFEPAELLGLSEVGLVCDPPAVAERLRRELGLELWDGSVAGGARLAFVGEKGRTLILCRAGRPWLPTGRPAEAHPVEVVLAGGPSGDVLLDGGSRVGRRATGDSPTLRASPSPRHDVTGG